MFADDTQIASASNDIKIVAGMLNNDLVNISDWVAANKLSQNASKTECMLTDPIKNSNRIGTIS